MLATTTQPRNCAYKECPNGPLSVQRRPDEHRSNFNKRRTCGHPTCVSATRANAGKNKSGLYRSDKDPADWWKPLGRDPGDQHPFDPRPFARHNLLLARTTLFNQLPPPTLTDRGVSTLLTTASHPHRSK